MSLGFVSPIESRTLTGSAPSSLETLWSLFAARDVACSVWKNCICFGFASEAVRPAAGTSTYCFFFCAMTIS